MTETSEGQNCDPNTSGAARVDWQHVKPMDAVAALYSTDQQALADAIFSSLSRAVFDQTPPRPASLPQRAMARLSYRLLKRTTVWEVGEAGQSRCRNRLLERSQHPYARALFSSSSRETEALVEGGDPMNGPYMMIVPEIRAVAALWDKLFFNSVQGKDVQLRFIWETRATYAEVKARLDTAESGVGVRIKALAAGTGLSLILAYDRLIRDGYDHARILARVTDRDGSNTAKTRRLLTKLAEVRAWKLGSGEEAGIGAETEDAFKEIAPGSERYDVVTAVGILEYLQGFTCETTEQRCGMEEVEEPSGAARLVAGICEMTSDQASLIVNTHRPHSSNRILELFGKRFDFRDTADMAGLFGGTPFSLSETVGSGLVYDVNIYKKRIV